MTTRPSNPHVRPASLSTTRGRRKHVSVRSRPRGLSSSSTLSDTSSITSQRNHHRLSLADRRVRVTPLHYPLRPHSVSVRPRGESEQSGGSSSGSSVGVDNVFVEKAVLAQTTPSVSSRRPLSPPKISLPPLKLSLSSRHASSSKSHASHRTDHSSIMSPATPRTPSPLRMTQRSNLYSTGSPSSGMLSLSSPLTPLLTTQMRKGGTLPSINTSWECDGEALLEGVFPDRELTVFVGTWNMQEHKELPQSADDFLLPLSHESAADLFVIGTQESSPNRKEWEILLQQTLGPTHVMLDSTSLGVINLVTFLRRDLIWYCSEVLTTDYLLRPGKLIKTKGAIATSFSLFGSSFLFITCHLSAHKERVAERNSDVYRIATNLSFPNQTSTGSVLDRHHYVFWCGDMNYRVDLNREEVDKLLKKNDLRAVLLRDQLTREILSGAVFKGFSEQPISFPPSYKFDVNSDEYDTSELARIPSWTDRVLFRSSLGTSMRGCGYSSSSSIKTSDHRPVYALFKVRLEPFSEVDGIPVNPATYSREVYVKALQRRKQLARLTEALQENQRQQDEVDTGAVSRATARTRNQTSSVICTIL